MFITGLVKSERGRIIRACKLIRAGCSALGHGAKDKRDVREAAPADVVDRTERCERGSRSVEISCQAGGRHMMKAGRAGTGGRKPRGGGGGH